MFRKYQKCLKIKPATRLLLVFIRLDERPALTRFLLNPASESESTITFSVVSLSTTTQMYDAE